VYNGLYDDKYRFNFSPPDGHHVVLVFSCNLLCIGDSLMFNGKILVKTRTMVPGSHRMESYQDTWQDSIDIAYDGELTSEVCTAIIEAFKKSRFMGKAQSGYGALRWSNGDTIIGVDKVKRQLILGSSMSLCD
jgi:hypothetical protein